MPHVHVHAGRVRTDTHTTAFHLHTTALSFLCRQSEQLRAGFVRLSTNIWARRLGPTTYGRFLRPVIRHRPKQGRENSLKSERKAKADGTFDHAPHERSPRSTWALVSSCTAYPQQKVNDSDCPRLTLLATAMASSVRAGILAPHHLAAMLSITCQESSGLPSPSFASCKGIASATRLAFPSHCPPGTLLAFPKP